ncbi:MAG TPA: thiamine-phosphate kinase [Nitrospira sp.]
MASPARPKAISTIREFDLIRALQQRHGAGDSSILRGIGDDAAVVAPSKNLWQLLTTDLLAEGIHFDLRTAAWSDIGFRAIAANLSDIAAMGGTPQYLLVALAIPLDGTGRQVHQLYSGMMKACRPYSVRLIGGDISASAQGWIISITLIGSVLPRRALLRSGARVGDSLYVTGTIGDSRAGLELLQRSRGKKGAASFSATHRHYLIQRHLRPTARVKFGRWLSTHQWATSAIDVSDGLSGDLRHICEESRVGAEISLSALPLSPACRAYGKSTGQDPTTLALAGGEDYELLFTVSSRRRRRFERMAIANHLQVTRIGTIRPARSGIHSLSPDGQRRTLPSKSYEHFRSKN